MWAMFREYFFELIRLSRKSSWTAANGIEGAALTGAAMIWRGSLSIISGEGTLILALNWIISFLYYVSIAWLFLFIFRTVLVAPFKAWVKQYAAVNALKAKIDDSPLRLREVEAQESQTTALRAQIEEMRLHRVQREKENDPLNKAFFEKRLEQYKKGETFEEETLCHIAHWIANRSAWGRWQDAQAVRDRGTTFSDLLRMQFAISALQIAAESGELIICGRRHGQVSMEPISPDFWRNVAGIGITNDIRSIYRIYVIRRSFKNDEPVELPTYSLLQSDMKRVRELWPAHDTNIDSKADTLLARHSDNG